MERLIEKQVFYISEFRQEEAWLSFMHRQGWKLVKPRTFKYEFEKCTEEDWVYQLDFKENKTEDEDYIRMFADYGWEFVDRYRNWFYFRKKKVEGEEMHIYNDNQSKLEMCKRIINGQWVWGVLICLVAVIFAAVVCGTDLFRDSEWWFLWKGMAIGACIGTVFGLGLVANQYRRLKKQMKDLQTP